MFCIKIKLWIIFIKGGRVQKLDAVFTKIRAWHVFQLGFKGCVSATFLLVYFVCLKESTCETRKNAFYFTLKALFVLEIIKFQILRYSNVMTSSNAKRWNTKHILQNNLGSKHSLVIKFGQFMYNNKIKFFIRKFYEKCGLETTSSPFLIFKESSVKRNLWRSACWFGLISIALLLHI